MNKPKKTPPAITVRVSDETLQDVQQEAKRERRPRSGMLAILIEEAIKARAQNAQAAQLQPAST